VASGGLRWRARVGERVEAAPALAGSRVFAVGEDPRTGRTSLRALDAATGRVLWTYSPQGVSVGTSSPSVSGTRVFVGFGDRVVRALEAATGRVLWQQPVRAGFSPRSSPAVAPGAVYVADVDGGLYRFDPVSGDRRWDFQFPAGVGLSAPLVVGGAVYVGLADGTVAAVASDTGHLVWRTRTRLGGVGPLTPAGGFLLAPGSTGPGGVVAFRHRSGALLDQRSPTEVRLLQALLNFAVAAVALLGVLLGASGLVGRRWRPSDGGSSRSAAHPAAGEPRG
jgi:outer membrane protein assembly factor BamB